MHIIEMCLCVHQYWFAWGNKKPLGCAFWLLPLLSGQSGCFHCQLFIFHLFRLRVCRSCALSSRRTSARHQTSFSQHLQLVGRWWWGCGLWKTTPILAGVTRITSSHLWGWWLSGGRWDCLLCWRCSAECTRQRLVVGGTSFHFTVIGCALSWTGICHSHDRFLVFFSRHCCCCWWVTYGVFCLSRCLLLQHGTLRWCHCSLRAAGARPYALRLNLFDLLLDGPWRARSSSVRARDISSSLSNTLG